MRDPHTVASIVRALRYAYGDDTARAMLTNGTTLAALIDALRHSPLTNRSEKCQTDDAGAAIQ